MNRVPLGTARIVTFFVVIAISVPALTQEPKPAAPTRETTTSESTFKIRAERNLVVVRVVVRDASGKAVTGLHKDDFRLFDNGKPQNISGFSVESPEAKVNPATSGSATQPPSPVATEAEHPVVMPDRFVALYFDDVHLPFDDVARTRDAAKQYLSDSLQPGDRAGVFTASGRLSQDFTADRDKLTQALDRLQPYPMGSGGLGQECPDISPYQAHLMVDLQNPDAIQFAVLDFIDCACHEDPTNCPYPNEQVMADARRVLEMDEMQSKYTLRQLETLIRRLSAMPGQRNVVLVSPGFFSDTIKLELSQITDRALRARVVISSLDSRGLYAIGGDASQQHNGLNIQIPGGVDGKQYTGGLQEPVLRSQFDRASRTANADALSQLAGETGGIFFENSNDYAAGFRRTGGLAETGYVLTFTPQSLKFDGSFHKLKVTLADSSGLTLQARRGYYAPKKSEDLAARVKDEMEEAIFSRDEMRELPVDVNTRFFKTGSLNAKLSVVAHIDVSSVHFRKQADRNLDNLMLVATLFDRDGNYVNGTETKLDMHLRDATLDRVAKTGIFLKTSLDVKVGTYFLRVVLRDSESTRISTLNRTVEIPY